MKILMIALPYHRYTHEIAEELRLAGNEVSLHDIQLRDFVTKGLRTLSPVHWQKRLDRHHRAILEAERGKHYDLVLFIQVHQMQREMLEAFRAEFSAARFHLYNWDSIANHNYLPYVDLFDRVLTFDMDDAARHNLTYLPLFCLREFQNLKDRTRGEKSVYFVGNLVKVSRYEAFRAFVAHCEAEGVPLRSHLACMLPVLVQLLKAGHWPKGIAYRHIEHASFIEMMEMSTAAFDFANHQQSGYTMRVIENLGARKKIITNNKRVLSESFYSPDRFHVYEGLDFGAIKAFLETPLVEPENDFPQYHIQAFVQHLLNGTGHVNPQAAEPQAADG